MGIKAIRARIDERLKDLNISPRAASLDAGMSADVIRDIRRKDGSPTIETIERLAMALATSPGWLAFAQGSKDGTAIGEDEQQHLYQIGGVAAGVWIEAETADRSNWVETNIAADSRYPAEAQYLLRPVGNSMNKVFPTESLLHCVRKESLLPRDGDIVIVERRRAGIREVSAKRLKYRDGAPVFRAESTDPQWDGYELTTDVGEDEQITAVATVLRTIQEFR